MTVKPTCRHVCLLGSNDLGWELSPLARAFISPACDRLYYDLWPTDWPMKFKRFSITVWKIYIFLWNLLTPYIIILGHFTAGNPLTHSKLIWKENSEVIFRLWERWWNFTASKVGWSFILLISTLARSFIKKGRM